MQAKPLFCLTGHPEKFDSVTKKTKIFQTWYSMMRRCHSAYRKYDYAKYNDCHVDQRFWSFSFFREWAEQQVGYGVSGFEIDKDILVRGNRIYSPETCAFVPGQINSCIIPKVSKKSNLPTGVKIDGRGFVAQIMVKPKTIYLGKYPTKEEAFAAYKDAKEQRIKEVAKQWQPMIDSRVFDALMAWEIKITD